MLLRKRITLAAILAGSLTVASCAATNTQLVKLEDNGSFKTTASLGDNAADCRGIAATLNEVVVDGATFVCVDAPE